MAPHSSTLAWKIPWTEKPGGLQSMWSQRVGHNKRLHFHALEKEVATHSSVLAWKIPGTGEPGGLPSMGSHRVGHDCSDLAAAAVISCERRVVIAHIPCGMLATVVGRQISSLFLVHLKFSLKSGVFLLPGFRHFYLSLPL